MIIYKAVNKINGKVYIGKTTRSLECRLGEHKHEKRMPFSRAFKKYGVENFNILIIDSANDEKELNIKEIKWIAYYRSKKPNGYNITDGGDGTSGVIRKDTSARNKKLIGPKNHMYGKIYTEEEKKKFGQPGIKNARYGVKLSEDLKNEISKKVKAAWQKPEMRKKIINSMIGRKRKKPISQELRNIRSEYMKIIWAKRKAAQCEL